MLGSAYQRSAATFRPSRHPTARKLREQARLEGDGERTTFALGAGLSTRLGKITIIICQHLGPGVSVELVVPNDRAAVIAALIAEEQRQHDQRGDDHARRLRWDRAVATKLADLARNSRRAYRSDLVRWEAFLDDAGTHPVDATVAHARVFARWQREAEALAPSTVARSLASLSGIYRDALATDPGLLVTNPFAAMRRPKISREAVTPSLTLDEARTFITSAGQVSTRAHALALLLLTTGLRISEALGANYADLGRHTGGTTTLTVTRKGDVRARIALPQATVAALEADLTERGSRTTSLERARKNPRTVGLPLFAGRSGRLSASEARREIQRICRAAGWPQDRVTAHGLRHSFATAAVEEAGVSVRQTQQALGHANVATTEGYLHDGQLQTDVVDRVAALLRTG
jgi:site-specific recombinase XerD